MAGVTIDTGPIHYRNELKDTPREKWTKVFRERRLYIGAEFKYGCRCVINWLAEAEEFHEELGYESADEMLEEELGIEPDWVRMAVAVLEATSKELSKAEVDHAIELKRHGGDRRSEEVQQDQGAIGTLKRGTNSADYIKARLRRDHPEIAEELEQGQHRSARAAGIAAGFIKDVAVVRMVEPIKSAKQILERAGLEFSVQLAIELAELTKDA